MTIGRRPCSTEPGSAQSSAINTSPGGILIVGDHGGKVVVGVLPALPVGDVRLHTQQPGFHLPYRLVGRDGDDVDGEHHVPTQIRQLRHQTVLDIGSVVLEIQHPTETFAEL